MGLNPKLILIKSESGNGKDLAFPKHFAANVAIVSAAEKENLDADAKDSGSDSSHRSDEDEW